MRVLIIGGTKFIGPYVVRHLLDRGHDVTVFHRGQTQADLPPSVRHIHGDRRDLAQYAAQFAQFAPHVVLDMIPVTEHDGVTLMQTVRGIAERVVAISSMDVYRAYDRLRLADPGPPDAVPLTEAAPLRDQLYPYRAAAQSADEWTYNYDKILVERAVMHDPQLPSSVLRLPAVYGPGDRQHRLGKYLRAMDDRRPAILLDEQMMAWRWTRGYVENVAAAIVLAITLPQAAHRIYNVGDEPALTEQEWIRHIGQHAHWSGRVVGVSGERLPAHLKQDLDCAQDLVADTGRIRSELGYAEIVADDQAIRRTIAWERANPLEDGTPTQDNYAAEDAVLAAIGAVDGSANQAEQPSESS
jgi:nucleoside-diphosphate-sugar epimerase